MLQASFYFYYFLFSFFISFHLCNLLKATLVSHDFGRENAIALVGGAKGKRFLDTGQGLVETSGNSVRFEKNLKWNKVEYFFDGNLRGLSFKRLNRYNWDISSVQFCKQIFRKTRKSQINIKALHAFLQTHQNLHSKLPALGLINPLPTRLNQFTLHVLLCGKIKSFFVKINLYNWPPPATDWNNFAFHLL